MTMVFSVPMTDSRGGQSDGPSGGGAAAILESLVAGHHPFSAQPLPAEHLCREPAVNAALWCALSALDAVALRQERRARLPDQVGKPWDARQDAELLRAFDGGEPLTLIAARLQRTRAGVRARLERQGRKVPRGTP